MIRSLLLDGILVEDPEAARAQVWAFDHGTVTSEIGRRVRQLADHASRKLPLIEPLAGVIGSRFLQSAPSDPVRHARDDELILPIEPDHWRAAKLGRILNHFNLRFAAALSEAELVHMCLEAEARAVALLRSLASSSSADKAMEPFDGSSTTELSRWVLRRMFVELDDSFARKPPEEQERIAEEIARRLAELPEDVRERIQGEAGVAELSADALKRTGVIAAVGGALVGTVGIAGFAAYTTVTSVIATAAGFVGLTLPFAVYIHATAALAFLSNPLLLTAGVLFGGHLALSRANRQMRDRFIPIMVATAAMASAIAAQPAARSGMVEELGRYFASLHSADRKLAAQIHNTFRCFPRHT